MKIPKAKVGKIPTAAYTQSAKDSLILFRGLNQLPYVSEGELTATKNIKSDYLPVIVQRDPRELIESLIQSRALFSGNSKLCWVEGTSFYYDGVSQGTVTATEKSTVDFNGKICIFPDKKYYDYGTDTFGDIGTGTYPTAGACPDIDFVCIHENRIVGLEGSNIYVTKQGIYDDWTTSIGASTDSYATDVGTEGDFTGIISHQEGISVAFKPNYIYEIMGDTAPFKVTLILSGVGTSYGKTIVLINKLIYFMGKDAFYVYDGSSAKPISDKLNEEYVSGSAGTDGRKYYCSLYNGTEYNLYVYDTWTGIWAREDDLQVKEFCNISGQLYALAFVEE